MAVSGLLWALSNVKEPPPPTSFVEVDAFAHAHKNEMQLHFQRTTHCWKKVEDGPLREIRNGKIIQLI